MIAQDVLDKTVAELATRPKHEKVRTLVHRLLVDALGADSTQIDFEKQVPEVSGRIDALMGRTVIEIKSDLRREIEDARIQLRRYLPERERATGQRYVGLVTDGAQFIAYETRGENLHELTRLDTKPSEGRNLVAWLEGVVAVQDRLPADALNIINELGRDSAAFSRTLGLLSSAWNAVADDPEPALKRQLWARHLGSVYGDESKLLSDHELWLQHTYLVTVAKAIAAGAMGFEDQSPRELLDGSRFVAAGVRGAVEEDFFGWILDAPGGEEIVERLVRHTTRFDLGDIEVDLLKVLYESLIDPKQRHDLGEYYTPDWLAAKVVRNAVKQPATDRVLDPSCGSGTFLFQTLRLKRHALEKREVPVEAMATRLSDQVFGFDVHPVAVIFARVTYLLGLGPALAKRDGEIAVPVYLGDALQWNVRRDHLEQDLIVDVPPDPAHPAVGPSSLRFPLSLCARTADFDRVTELMEQAADGGHSPDVFVDMALRAGAHADETATLSRTYIDFRRLRDAGRDHIWTYVARNLSRPVAVSEAHPMDVIVGNPPWLSYRYMSQSMQARFRDASRAMGVWVGADEARLVTQLDLSGLFFARAVQLYLRRPPQGESGGRIAMVLPLAAMTRGQFRAFRSGAWDQTTVSFDSAWVLDNQEISPLFRVPTCVLFATRTHAHAKGLPDRVTSFVGRLPSGRKDASEKEANRYVQVFNTPAPATVSFAQGSPYRKRFLNGATLYPRLLCLVERSAVGRLGVNFAAPIVRSEPRDRKGEWKSVTLLEGPVEAEFLRPVYLGESIAPFRTLSHSLGVIPMTSSGDMLDQLAAANRGHHNLASWMKKAESLWNQHGSGRISLVQQFNHIGKLASQAGSRPLRVVFSKSGTLPAATVLRDAEGVIDHALYWMPIQNEAEGQFLIAVLNSETARFRVAHLQARGEQGARHFDKLFFTLPIPQFDRRNDAHIALAEAGIEAEAVAAAVAIDPTKPFTRARRDIRQALADAGVSARIDAMVDDLLGPDEHRPLSPNIPRLKFRERERRLNQAEAWIADHKDDPSERRMSEEAEFVQEQHAKALEISSS